MLYWETAHGFIDDPGGEFMAGKGGVMKERGLLGRFSHE